MGMGAINQGAADGQQASKVRDMISTSGAAEPVQIGTLHGLCFYVNYVDLIAESVHSERVCQLRGRSIDKKQKIADLNLQVGAV